MKTKAFTLLEIMIIMVIIGILSAMAIPMVSKVRANVAVTAEEKSSPEYKVYLAWQKLDGHMNVTFPEWKLLRDAGLLQRPPQ